jgi:hypothetical protein
MAIDFSLYDPATFGLQGWAYPPLMSSGSVGVGTGIVHASKIGLPPGPVTLSSLVVGVIVAGTGLTANECFGALYDNGGNLLAVTADQSATWETIDTYLPMPLGPVTVRCPWVYGALLSNGGTPPKLLNSISGTGGANLGADTAHLLFLSAGSGALTTMPAQLGEATANAQSIWMGVS